MRLILFFVAIGGSLLLVGIAGAWCLFNYLMEQSQ